jgi:uncharacterized protein YerC
MASKIAIREISKDDDYGVIKKDISIIRSPTFQTPTKCVKNLDSPLPVACSINEVTKRVSLQTIDAVAEGRERPRELLDRCKSDKLNFTIFDLTLDKVPDRDITKTLSSYWYASSENLLVVPTVRTRLLQEDETLSEKRIAECVSFLDDLITITELKNYKAFMGTIPLLPFKFSKMFVHLYLEKGFNAFAIDVGNRDVLNHIADLRSILIEINETVPLNQAFIYACNLAIPRFEQSLARADDFLSLFAYIDAVGNTFKPRGGGGDENKPKPPPRAKKFLKEDLAYKMLHENPTQYNGFNQREQVKEADTIKELVGVEKMQKYLSTKKAVDSTVLKHLDAVMEKVKIK